jgi:hypothetical protein
MVHLNETFFSVVFLRVRACEAAVGLGCIVGMARVMGANRLGVLECGNNLCVYRVIYRSDAYDSRRFLHIAGSGVVFFIGSRHLVY